MAVTLLILLCAASLLIEKGALGEAGIKPMLLLCAGMASLAGGILSAKGYKEKRLLLAAVPGAVICAAALAGRVIMPSAEQGSPMILSLVAAAMVPSLFIGLRRRRVGKKR